MPIFICTEELNDEQEKEQRDSYQKCIREMERLEKEFFECAKKKKELEQEISSDKVNGVLKADMAENIKTLQYKQNMMKKEYGNLEEKVFDFSMGIERERFAELNDSEKELFGILLCEIKQEDMAKMREDRWEEFPISIRKRIVELLKELRDEEQWQPVGASAKKGTWMGQGMELKEGVIEYKMLHPREYRLYKVTEMMLDDMLTQEKKDSVLEMIDRTILKAYKTLSKAINDVLNDKNENEDIRNNIERLKEKYIEDAQKKN